MFKMMNFAELMSLVGIPLDEFEPLHSALGGFLINRAAGMLDFIDPMLREAVQKVFLEHRSLVKEFRNRLARFLEERYTAEEAHERFSEVSLHS